MTDKEKVTALLTELGVEFKEDNGNIYCTEGDKKVSGYSWFYVLFEFDEVGQFISIGAYE